MRGFATNSFLASPYGVGFLSPSDLGLSFFAVFELASLVIAPGAFEPSGHSVLGYARNKIEKITFQQGTSQQELQKDTLYSTCYLLLIYSAYWNKNIAVRKRIWYISQCSFAFPRPSARFCAASWSFANGVTISTLGLLRGGGVTSTSSPS